MCFNKDVLFLIFKELKNDKKSLYSCLLVNRTWCVVAMPILWRNPGQTLLTKKAGCLLFDVTLLHLSEESRDILKNQGYNNLITETYQRPLFNYINFCKYLDLLIIERMISSKNIERSNVSFIRNVILKLFINGNTKLICLSIRQNYDYQLYHIPGVEHCFSELESFHCDVKTNQDMLEGLARICKSIKKLRFYNNSCMNSYTSNNFGMIKLIEVQKNLNDVSFIDNCRFMIESFKKTS